MPPQRGVKHLMAQLAQLEKINETLFFKFSESQVQHITNSALYLSVKKAFTPFAVLYILKQMQIADQLKRAITITEKSPFLLYKIRLPTEVNGVKLVQKFKLEASSETPGLRNLECSCSFYLNYRMICWHMVALLDRLQIKHIAPFEHL